MLKRDRVLAVLLPLLLTPATCLGGEPTDQIKKSTDKILAIVRDADLKDPAKAAERTRRIRAADDERFAWPEIARRALGPHWNTPGVTDDQKREFTDLFRELIEQAYLGEIERYSGEEIRYVGDTVEGNAGVVQVVFVTRKNIEIKVEYRVFRRKLAPGAQATQPSPWLVYDFTVDGISMVNNYRTQINDIMAKGTFQDVIKRLKAKIAENAAQAQTQPAKSATDR